MVTDIYSDIAHVYQLLYTYNIVICMLYDLDPNCSCAYEELIRMCHACHKMCTFDLWYATFVCRLTKHVRLTNLLMWCMSSVAQVFNRTKNPYATKKVHTRF